MPVKITKRSKKTKKGKVTQSQQVVVNINKGKRKASSQPVMRHSQPPIIIQQPQPAQPDYSQLENLFKQYSTSRSVAEPKPVTMGMETQTEQPISISSGTQTAVGIPANLEESIKLEQKKLREKLAAIEEEKPIPVKEKKEKKPTLRETRVKLKPPVPIQENRPPVTLLPVRRTALATTKIINPDTRRPIKIGGDVYKKLLKEGKIIPE
jgi:hypothetical protein